MPTLEELQNKYGKKEASELLAHERKNVQIKSISPKEILPIKNIEIEKKVQISSFVGGFSEDIEYDIDFTALANSSDFKRLIYLAITGKVWRGTNAGLELSLKSKLKKLNGSDWEMENENEKDTGYESIDWDNITFDELKQEVRKNRNWRVFEQILFGISICIGIVSGLYVIINFYRI